MNGPEHRDVRVSDNVRVTERRADFGVLILGFDRVFLAEAALAAERAGRGFAQQDSAVVAGATAAAILLAAAACEARLSEYVTAHESALGPMIVAALRNERDAFKQWRALLTHRGAADAPDSSSRLACLFKVRDLVAHRNARHLLPGEWPDKLKDCVAKGAVPVHPTTGVDWTSAVYVHDVAVWAHQTAADWLTTASSLGITASGEGVGDATSP